MFSSLLLACPGAWCDDVAPDPTQYAVYAGGNLTLGDGAEVSGHLGAGASMTVESDAWLSGGVFADASVLVRSRVEMAGPAHAGGTLTVQDDGVVRDWTQAVNSMSLGDGVVVDGGVWSGGTIVLRSDTQVGGEVNAYSPLPHSWTMPVVSMPSFAPGSSSVVLGTWQTRELEPGRYGSLTLRTLSTLRLSTGVYHFSSLDASQSASIEIDDDAGPVEIYVAGDLETKRRFAVTLDSDDGENLQWFVGGTTSVGNNSRLLGVLRCAGSVSIGREVSTNGSIIALGSVSCGDDCVLRVSDSGRTFYVTAGGNDANPGTSVSAPLRTIQAAINKCVKPGSSVIVAPGVYEETLSIGTGSGAGAVSGTEDEPTRFIADTTGELTNRDPGSVILRGAWWRSTGVRFSGVHNWSIEGLTIEGFGSYGVYATGCAPSIIGCTFDLPGSYSIYAVIDEDFLVSGCRFERDSGWGNLIWVQPSAGVRDLGVHITGNDAGARGADYLGSGFDRGPGGLLGLLTGLVSGLLGPGSLQSSGVIVYSGLYRLGEVEISNNILTDMAVPVYFYNRGGREPVRIINNTIAGSFSSIYVDSKSGNELVYIHNNIVEQCYYGVIAYDGYGSGYEVAGLLEHDITYHMGSFGRPFEFDIITGDPGFHEPETGDFALWSDSPAVDAGTGRFAPPEDIGARLRPSDGDNDGVSIVDLGAFELVFRRAGDRVHVVMWEEIAPSDD